MSKRCPKCKQELELMIDDEPKQVRPYFTPTQAYYHCLTCGDCFPIYGPDDEA